jgi:hypothetical protein
MISLEQGVELVWTAFEDMAGGEIYVRKIPSMNIVDIASAIAPGKPTQVVGIRPGEKLHEQMIGPEDALTTYEYKDYYKALPTPVIRTPNGCRFLSCRRGLTRTLPLRPRSPRLPQRLRSQWWDSQRWDKLSRSYLPGAAVPAFRARTFFPLTASR